ncbi:hypothetical protein LWI29_025293 [Acer saccharum]|uniref:Uncharacterized protein n=1 Tax=Acer saccharum TaxID=4024 RepID=A0AA39W2V8_ACESA|nr:hypothetical protein LWI29_025293 [Acer saccharum]
MFHPGCLRLMLQLVTRSGGSNWCRVCNVQERVFCDQKGLSEFLIFHIRRHQRERRDSVSLVPRYNRRNLMESRKGIVPLVVILFCFKEFQKLLESSKWREKDINASVTLDSPQKHAQKSVEISKEKEKVCDVSASAGLPLEKLPLSQMVQKKLNLAEAEETTQTSEEDGMTIAELLRSRKRHNAVGSGQLGDGESLALIENFTLNATVETGLETAKEDADATETGSPSHDMERFQGCESDGNQYAVEMQELQLEEQV